MKIDISRSRWALGGALIALGLIAGLGFLLLSIFSVFSSLLRVPSPGAGEVELPPGNYTVYWESPMLAMKRSRPPGGFLDIVSKESGLPVQYSTDIFWPVRYNTVDHLGASVAEFTIERKGTYRFILSEANLKQPVPGGISIGKAVGPGSFVQLALIPVTLVVGGVGAGLLVLLKRPEAA
jgi:hypothetical protein